MTHKNSSSQIFISFVWRNDDMLLTNEKLERPQNGSQQVKAPTAMSYGPGSGGRKPQAALWLPHMCCVLNF